MKRLKYLLVYTLPITVCFSFNSQGIITFIPFIIFFGFVPLLELFLKPDASNFDKETTVAEKNNPIYDWVMYLALPVQVGMLIYFLFIIQDTPLGTVEYFGRVSAMGLMCGVLGINVGHELGHRHNRKEQFIGEILLLTSLDTHFLPYHNAGHHRDVATPNDAGYWKAWNLENQRLRQSERSPFSIQNRMIIYSIANVVLLLIIFYFFKIHGLIAFVGAAILGIMLLETVNYIEHYGLMRQKTEAGTYERVKHHHSWNSDHPIGRLLLFNLSRHSDHHYNGSKKYAVLKSLPQSPQMPTGYPGMMVLALFQPLWFILMNRKFL